MFVPLNPDEADIFSICLKYFTLLYFRPTFLSSEVRGTLPKAGLRITHYLSAVTSAVQDLGRRPPHEYNIHHQQMLVMLSQNMDKNHSMSHIPITLAEP